MSSERSDLSAAGVQQGDILAGKYRVDAVLGVGGMGVVVAATHLDLEQQVALKFMLSNSFANDEARKRFQREARAASKLRSEHVAAVKDTGLLENGSPYIVMEYLTGRDLAAEVEANGPLALAMAAECVIQACDAIGEAHANGIIHRDLKPANLFLTYRSDGSPLVKVLDFGISKNNVFADGDVSMTKTSAVLGSPLYMSPEQMRSSKEVDLRTDVWALGIVLYELLGGRPPFVSNTLGELMFQVMSQPAAPLASVRPEVPADVSALVDKCLAKDPAQRVANTAEIVRALAPHCPARSLHIVDRVSSLMAQGPGGNATQSPNQQSFAESRKLGASAPSIGAAFAAVGATAALPVPAQTSSQWGGTKPEAVPPPSKAGRVVAIVGALVAVVGIVGVGAYFGLRGHASSAGEQPANVATQPPAPPTAPSPPTAVPPVPSAAPGVASAEASASASGAVAEDTRPPMPPSVGVGTGTAPPPTATATNTTGGTVPGAGTAHPTAVTATATATAHPVSTTAKTAAKPSCDPPFYIDAKGHKIFKSECM
jgi:serine/threonine-protein kinase